MASSDSLETVIASQARELAHEAKSARLPPRRGEIRFSELSDGQRFHIEGGRSVCQQPKSWGAYLGTGGAFDAASQPANVGQVGMEHLGEYLEKRSCPIRCPVCLGRPLARGAYCLGCDRAGLDPMDDDPGHPFKYRGWPVGSMIDYKYVQTYKLVDGTFRRRKPRPPKRRLRGGRE